METEHQTLVKIPIVHRSINFFEVQQPVPTALPVPGQHIDEFLNDALDLISEQMEELRSLQVVA